MSNFIKIIDATKIITEMTYPGNIGFEEIVAFYQKATQSQIKELEKVIKDEDWEGFKTQIKKVLNIKLK